MSIHSFIDAMPKAELHIHLEGAIAPATLLQLAERHGHALPADTVDGLLRWYQFTTFRHFVEIYVTIQACIKDVADFSLIAYEFGADRARQNIRYTEATVTPYTHIWQKKGTRPEEIIEGLEDGRVRAKRDFGVEMRWVFDIPRTLPEPAGSWTADFAVQNMKNHVVGFGLGGDEANGPAELWTAPFARAVDAGLHSVPHAGELAGPPSVWAALLQLRAQRIGHGVRSIEDPKLIEFLVEKQIPLELNPTSNLRLNVYPDFERHPLRALWDAGVFVTVNSDDPPMFNTTLTNEYHALVSEFSFSAHEIERVALNAVRAAAPLGLTRAEKQAMELDFQRAFATLRDEHGIKSNG